ncbi:hypothetical protein HYPSUDRAFT_669447 [Hypholoma sublateritium FD-334 SS-4]|uniref:Uncharacterized protein n=1 Tax=Hypholoma sublateritium (strain FD-334 SS-4) TaxID=945553 RepID=A0A0D2NTN5_HYPSF|nr:hypothetical protein HYPSUDRAFT_669447 [Hypholoma sublateritium FD-334 SS-4]
MRILQEHPESNVALNDGFALEFCRLVEDNRTGELRDRNHNLNAPPSLIGVDIVEDSSLFVSKVVNRTSYHVYPALFYFDNCDFSIQCLYQPPSAGNNTVDPPLKANQTLIIGNGSQGLAPFVVGVRRPRTLETGYLKLFISSTYVDLSDIPHRSLFNPSTTRGLVPYVWKQLEIFGSFMIPFVVRPEAPDQRTQGSGSRTRGEPQIQVSFKDSSAWGTVVSNSWALFYTLEMICHYFQFTPSPDHAPPTRSINERSRQVHDMEHSLQEMENVITELQCQQTRSAAQLDSIWVDLAQMETAMESLWQL